MDPAEQEDRKVSDVGRDASTKELKSDVNARRGMNAFTVLVLFTSTLGGLAVGFDTGTTAITSMNTFRQDAGIPLLVPNVQDSPATVNQVTLFAVLFHVFTLIGAPISGYLTDRWGRRVIILMASTLFLVGALWQAVAGLINPSNTWMSILLGRCLGGIGNGFMLSIVPLYSAELSPPQYRGQVVTIFQLFVTIGIMLMAIANIGLEKVEWGWRLCIALQAVPCAVMILITLLVLPESPQFLVKVDRVDEARKALAKLAKGSGDTERLVELELEDIRNEIEELEGVKQGSILDLFKGRALPATLCGVGLSFCQNVTGVNYLMNYATVVFNSLGFNPFAFDLILKSLNMVATVVAILVIDRLGRKFFTFWGTVLTFTLFFIMSFSILGTGVDINSSNQDNLTRDIQILVAVALFVFQVVFAICWGGVSWVISSESFPVHLRGAGMSLAVVANMATNISLGDYGYAALASVVGLGSTLLVIALLNVLIVFPVVVFFQAETKGVSMQDMRRVFAYQKGGIQGETESNLRHFFRRNFKQSKQVLRFRPVKALPESTNYSTTSCTV